VLYKFSHGIPNASLHDVFHSTAYKDRQLIIKHASALICVKMRSTGTHDDTEQTPVGLSGNSSDTPMILNCR